jgi:hypothetical protein
MSKTSSIFDCSIITLDKNHRVKGNLTVINNFSELPFDVKRVYFLIFFLILSKLVDVIKDQTEDVVARWGVIK